MTAAEDEIRRLADIEAIKQLRSRYTRAIDTKDWARFGEALTEDAVLSTDRGVDEGREHIVEVISRALATATTVHHIHQPEIAITGPGTATGIWAMNDVVIFDSFTLRGWGHYTEEYVLHDGSWRIGRSTLTRLRVETEGELPKR